MAGGKSLLAIEGHVLVTGRHCLEADCFAAHFLHMLNRPGNQLFTNPSVLHVCGHFNRAEPAKFAPYVCENAAPDCAFFFGDKAPFRLFIQIIQKILFGSRHERHLEAALRQKVILPDLGLEVCDF